MDPFEEFLIEGSEVTLRAFVLGFVAGRGASEPGHFGVDLDVDPDSFGERLKALFTAGSHHLYFAPSALAEPLAAALERHGKELSLRLERRRTVESASFTFRYEVYSREMAAEMKRAFMQSLPPGVRVEDFSERQEVHPEAHGTELYAPLHAYIARGSGRIVGEFSSVIAVWKRCHDREFVKYGRLTAQGKTHK